MNQLHIIRYTGNIEKISICRTIISTPFHTACGADSVVEIMMIIADELSHFYGMESQYT